MEAARRPFQVRAARPEDAAALAGLLDELGFPAAAEVVVQRLAALERSGEATLVGLDDGGATAGGGVQGFVTVHVTPVLHRPTPVGRMTALVVTSRARRRGLGRALVAAAEAYLAEAGCALVEVTSNRDLAGAHAFYGRLGYALTSYRFRKALTPTPDQK